jgi:diacylglycerol kinase (ATP)
LTWPVVPYSLYWHPALLRYGPKVHGFLDAASRLVTIHWHGASPANRKHLKMKEKKTKYFSPHGLLKSFGYAAAGIVFCLRTQRNALIHLLAAIAVIAAGVLLGVSPEDWRWLVLAISLVWFAELVNTAFEHLCDVVSPDFNSSVRAAKDVAAGAVLICSLGAAVIGILTFLPYLSALIDRP